MLKFFKTVSLFFAIAITISSCGKRTVATNSFQQEMYSNQDFMASSSTTIQESVREVETPVVSKETKPEANVVAKVKRNAKASSIKPAKITKEKRAEIVKSIKETKSINSDKKFSVGAKIGLVILAIILPFLSVLIVDGGDFHFWLSLLFTILGFLPGLMYAIIRIFRH